MTRHAISASLLLTALAASPAQAETWCLRSFGQERGACVFSTARDCAAAAQFNAFGGVCERETLGGQKGMKPRLSDSGRAVR